VYYRFFPAAGRCHPACLWIVPCLTAAQGLPMTALWVSGTVFTTVGEPNWGTTRQLRSSYQTNFLCPLFWSARQTPILLNGPSPICKFLLISISSRCSTWSPQTGETSPQLFFHSCWSTTQSVHRVNAIYIYSICIHIYIYIYIYCDRYIYIYIWLYIQKKHREKTNRTVASLAPGDQLLNQGLIPSPPRWGSRYS